MAKTKRPPQTRKKLGGPRITEGGPRRDKADAVEVIQAKLAESTAVLLSEYRGMTVHELADLRAGLRESGAEYKVYKNTLASIAARNAGFEELTQHFVGPTAFTFTTGDPVIAAKKLSEFAKKVPTLVLKGGVLGSRVLTAKDVTALGNLESREVMLAKAAGMFISPIQQAANLFAAGFNQLGAVLAQLRDKLPAEGTQAPPEPEAKPEASQPEATSIPEQELAEAVEPEPAPDPAPVEEASAAEPVAETSNDENTEG